MDQGQNHFIRQRVEQLTELPPMPEMARRLFELRANPDAGADALVKIVELDPSLAAQVLRYANSPYFGYRGKVDSLQVAIVRVLGFDMVMNLAMGLALLQSFKIPRHGPLGLDAFWKHAVFSANLMQMLCKAMPKGNQPRLSTCYLIGLLHDFGYLVLGHLFREEFLGLSERLGDGNDHKERVAIERDYLGIDHGQLGHWLLKAWGLPDEIVVATREHHTDHYHGSFGVYVQMAHLSDYLLRVHASGQVAYEDIPEDTLKALGLSQGDVIKVMVQLLEQDENLETMARQLAA
jgi:HD-like signal output (HDOD) protein